MRTKGHKIMDTTKRDDDDDVLIGNPAMAEFSTSEGFKISVSTMQKYTRTW